MKPWVIVVGYSAEAHVRSVVPVPSAADW